MKLTIGLVAAISAWVAGCAVNPYTKNYTVNPDRIFGPNTASPVSKSENIRVVRIRELTSDLAEKTSKAGFTQLGVSTFTSAIMVRESQVLAHARKIGAELVLLEERYSHSENGLAGVTTYKPGTNVTTTTTGNVSVYGTTGTALANYGATTTTTSAGTIETTYVPATFHFVRYSASFYAK